MGPDLAPSENQHTVLRPESILTLVQNTVQTDSTLPIVKADLELFGFFLQLPSQVLHPQKAKKSNVSLSHMLFFIFPILNRALGQQGGEGTAPVAGCGDRGRAAGGHEVSAGDSKCWRAPPFCCEVAREPQNG